MAPTRNNLTLNQKVDRVMSSPAESFAERYFHARDLVKTLRRDERSQLVEIVKGLYASNTLAALGFTYYGRLIELEDKVIEQVCSADGSNASIAIETVRELMLQKAYPTLQNQFSKMKNTSLEGNLLIAMFKLSPPENLVRHLYVQISCTTYQKVKILKHF